ncbi:Fe-S protein [Georgenia sp. TF02-10]|uniref:Fe-S protein n=1 Tax=Georgenia sp. TF02-10 TaxID=2917725 RepID=UPI001FA7E615|nr:Fe-S protein [Georgenia sp. TF02-10]UNX55523.1 Fe-S protein [Georgenia sp. TF02-10]
MDFLETLRGVVVLVHLVAFAIMFGAWTVEAAARRYQATRLMNFGVLVALVSGLVLSAPWGVDGELNYVKIGIKLVVLIVVAALTGISTSRTKKGPPLPTSVFWLIGALVLFNAGIAVLW